MKISDLPRHTLREELERGSVGLRTGPFVTRITTSVPAVADGLSRLYGSYSLTLSPEFADFHVAVVPGRRLRRWIKPQVLFLFDGWTPFKPLPSPQAFAVFEWGMNWCVANHAHQYLIIHSAVVEKGGCAVLMPGSIGAGKSTLAAALVLRGWRLLTDELGVVSLEHNRLIPVPRPVGLKNQSIEVIRAFSPEAEIGPLCLDTLKGTVAHMKAPDDSVLRDNETVPLRYFLFPRYKAGAALRFEPCSRADTFMRVAGNSFNYHILGEQGFRSLGRLVEQCDGYEIEYSRLDEAIAAIEELRTADSGSRHVRAYLHES